MLRHTVTGCVTWHGSRLHTPAAPADNERAFSPCALQGCHYRHAAAAADMCMMWSLQGLRVASRKLQLAPLRQSLMHNGCSNVRSMTALCRLSRLSALMHRCLSLCWQTLHTGGIP